MGPKPSETVRVDSTPHAFSRRALAMRLVAPVAIVWALASGCREGAPTGSKGAAAGAGVAASTRAMAERLDRLRDAVRSERNDAESGGFFVINKPWLIEFHRRRLEGERNLAKLIEARWRLARELLFDGRSEEALAELDQLWGLVEATGAQRPVDAQRQLQRALRDTVAVTFLRLGEQRNCIHRHGPRSCLFPIEGGGVHADQEASRAAIGVLTESLAADPSDHGSRWLLNIAWMTLGGYPDRVPDAWRIPPARLAPDAPFARFENVAQAAGAATFGLAGGSVLEDLDGDERLDIAVSSWGLDDPLRILRNRGDGSFEDRTAVAGVEGEDGGLNLSGADYDNDGDFDLLVLRGGWLGDRGALPNSLLRNRGDGSFDDVTVAAGLDDEQPGQVAAWADFDGDGWLDLFVGNESMGAAVHPCRLYRNRGDGTFEDIARDAGIAALGWVKGAAWGDYDDDGRPDLYVSRVGQPNLLFENEGPAPAGDARRWIFREVAEAAGVEEPIFSFPCWFFDYDNDGRLDLFVAPYDNAKVEDVGERWITGKTTKELPRLYRNRGDGTFDDVTRSTRLDRVLLVMGANHGDVDNDGFEDIYLGTGAPDYRTLTPNRLFRNVDGQRFDDVTVAAGLGHLQKGHGISFGDYDDDGDRDILAVMGGWYSGDGFQNALFRNPGASGRWLRLRLVGTRANRSAIGARVHVMVRRADGSARSIRRVVGTGGSFGVSTTRLEIGLGDAARIESVEVRWPGSGRVQTFRELELDRRYELREGADAAEPKPPPRS